MERGKVELSSGSQPIETNGIPTHPERMSSGKSTVAAVDSQTSTTAEMLQMSVRNFELRSYELTWL